VADRGERYTKYRARRDLLIFCITGYKSLSGNHVNWAVSQMRGPGVGRRRLRRLARNPGQATDYHHRPPARMPGLASSLAAMTDAHEVVAAYWAAAEARDWDAFGALLAEDVIYRGPQTREQVRGRDAYIRFNVEGFAYDWHIAVQQIVGEGQRAASWIEFTGQEGTQPGLCFFDLGDDGKIARITDFWPDPYELPASRAHLVERY